MNVLEVIVLDGLISKQIRLWICCFVWDLVSSLFVWKYIGDIISWFHNLEYYNGYTSII